MPDLPPPSESEQTAASLHALSQGGADILKFLAPHAEPSGTPPSPGPGTRPATLRDQLSESELQELADDATDLCDDYERAAKDFFDIEQEIRDAYAMRADATHSGTGVEAAQMVSELTMNLTDQVTARLNSNILGVTPLAKVEPIATSDDDDQRTKDLLDSARAAENFLQWYFQEVVKVGRKVPLINLRSVKLGTTVVYVEWQEEFRRTFAYTKEHETAQPIEGREGRLVWNLVPSRHVKIWPITLPDWQDGYELVGHDMYLSPARWREMCGALDISDECRDLALNAATGGDDRMQEENLEGHGVTVGPVRDRLDRNVKITNLMLDTVLPGRRQRERTHLLLDRQNRKVCWLDHNKWHNQMHSYFPIRYKLKDEFGWGDGLGHEVQFNQAADSTYWNLEIDSMMATAFYLILMKPDMLHQLTIDRPIPGQVVPTDDPANDLRSEKLGGPLPELQEAKTANDNRARMAAGIPPVLSGMGDPVQKSGTGSGATKALVEQGGQKIGDVDRQMREDYSALIQFSFEAIAQCAPEGVYYSYAPDKDVHLLRSLKWTPPRGELGKQFKVTATAPNANTSFSARQESWLLLWQYLKDFTQTTLPQAIELLMAENPGAVPRLKRQSVEAAVYFVQRVIEAHQIPGALQHVWTLPAELPQDQVIGNYVKLVQDLQQQLAAKHAGKDKPAESIPIDKIPPPGMANPGQVQMLEQAGIHYPQSPPGGAPGAPPPGPGQPPPGAFPSPGAMPGPPPAPAGGPG
jgi:hypothetical protein